MEVKLGEAPGELNPNLHPRFSFDESKDDKVATADLLPTS